MARDPNVVQPTFVKTPSELGVRLGKADDVSDSRFRVHHTGGFQLVMPAVGLNGTNLDGADA